MKKGLMSFVAATMLASSAMAVNIATDGTGDYLIAPQFSVANGYTTNLKLLNTDNEHSFLIRGVVRSSVDSHELFDFTVMMSPGDVWEATLADGRMVSDDDSNWEGKIDQSLNGEERGYVEFFVLAELDNNNTDVASRIKHSNYSANYLSTTVDVAKVEKSDLKELFTVALGASNSSELANGNQPDTTYVVEPSNISNDAIAGFVTLENPATQTLRATIPMFAFEDTRDGNANVDSAGFVPGELTRVQSYIGNHDAADRKGQTAIRDLLRAKVVSIPFDLEGATKVNFTYILDGYDKDPAGDGIQNRTYKQVVRNMSEKFPVEVGACPADLVAFVKANYPDAADGSISPYVPPKCTITPVIQTLNLVNEMNSITAEGAVNFEASKKYKRTIVYQDRNQELKTVVDEFAWNDFDVNDYQKGMLQIHNITNVYDAEDNVQYDDGQTVDQTLDAAFIPTFFNIKYVGGNPVLNWDYAPAK